MAPNNEPHLLPVPTPPDDAWSTSTELFSTMTEHVVVFEVVVDAREKWWAWCVVDLGGVGFSRVRWSKMSFGAPTVFVDPPDLEAHRSRPSASVVFSYDTPVVTDDAKAG